MPKSLRIKAIARTCHEANRAYCVSMGDVSQLPWDESPQWQRDSAINGVRFHIDNPHALPSASHECWLSQKLAEGWKFGPAKDPAAKEHPCCVPYTELPAEQRVKDYIFGAIVDAFMEANANEQKQEPAQEPESIEDAAKLEEEPANVNA